VDTLPFSPGANEFVSIRPPESGWQQVQQSEYAGYATRSQAAFTYFDDSQVKTITRSVGSTHAEVATSTYGYDDLQRLTSLNHAHQWRDDRQLHIRYDLASNMQSMAATIPNSSLNFTTNFTGYDAVNDTDIGDAHEPGPMRIILSIPTAIRHQRRRRDRAE